MGKLIALLVSGIPAIIAGILGFLTRKVATATGAIASFIVLAVAFIAAINVLINTLTSSLAVPSWIANSVGLFVPGDFAVCTSAVVSAHIARAAYDMAVYKLKMITAAS